MLIPLIYTDRLPMFQLADLHILAPMGRPAPEPERAAPQQRTTAKKEFVDPTKFYAPFRTPDKILMVDDPPLAPGPANLAYVEGGIYDPRAGGLGILNRVAANPLPAPPDPHPATAGQAKAPEPVIPRIRIGGAVQAARLVKRVIPVYPPLARQARVSGTVELLGIIGRDGTVHELHVISGHPLLVAAALDAVRQWIYRPTLLNGEPVEVIAPVEVHFTLGQ